MSEPSKTEIKNKLAPAEEGETYGFDATKVKEDVSKKTTLVKGQTMRALQDLVNECKAHRKGMIHTFISDPGSYSDESYELAKSMINKSNEVWVKWLDQNFLPPELGGSVNLWDQKEEYKRIMLDCKARINTQQQRAIELGFADSLGPIKIVLDEKDLYKATKKPRNKMSREELAEEDAQLMAIATKSKNKGK